MKTFLSHNDRYIADVGADARKERRFYIILSILSFICGAFILWEINYEVWNMIGSVASNSPDRAVTQTVRMLPLYLTGLAVIVFFIATNGAYRAKSEKARIAKWAACGIVTIVLGACIAVYVALGVLFGEYAKFTEGYLTPLFPLDILLAGLVLICVGFLSLSYSKKLKTKPSVLPYVTDRGLFGWRLCTFGVLRALSLLIAMCGFVACVIGTWVIDFSHGYILYSVVLWLNYFAAFAMFVAYKYVFCEVKAESRGEAAVKLGCFFLIVNAVLFGLHLLTVQIWNEAPNVAAFGILPADFLTSMNIFGLFYGINNLLAPAIAIVRGLIMRKKN